MLRPGLLCSGEPLAQLIAGLARIDVACCGGEPDALGPRIERRQLRQMCQMPAIAQRHAAREPPAFSLRQLCRPPRYGQARSEALQVPLERRRQCLVEIVDVEDA